MVRIIHAGRERMASRIHPQQGRAQADLFKFKHCESFSLADTTLQAC